MMPAPMMSRDAFAGILRRRESRPARARARLRLLQDAHRDLGDDAEQALRAGDDAEQIVAAGVEMLAADARRPRRSSAPSRSPSTLLVVMPYFRQCTPPEFSATLPPMVQAICEDGSGA